MRALLISGSTRAASTNAAALATLARLVPAPDAALIYPDLAQLPAFNPDDDRDPLPVAVADLRRAIAAADAIVFCTPEYAGTLPGSVKNLLDWTVGGTELSGKPAAWINVAASGRGRGAIATLELVLGYVQTDLVREACLEIPVGRDQLGPDGLITDDTVRAELRQAWEVLRARS